MMLLAELPLGATVTPVAHSTAPVPVMITASAHPDGDMTIRESLSRDVSQHPNDFIVFGTEAGAERFVAEHQAQREADKRIVARGVIGYWQGKTIVVLPWEPLKSSQ